MSEDSGDNVLGELKRMSTVPSRRPRGDGVPPYNFYARHGGYDIVDWPNPGDWPGEVYRTPRGWVARSLDPMNVDPDVTVTIRNQPTRWRAADKLMMALAALATNDPTPSDGTS